MYDKSLYCAICDSPLNGDYELCENCEENLIHDGWDHLQDDPYEDMYDEDEPSFEFDY